MPRNRSNPDLPACYAIVVPGLEAVAGEEIADTLGGETKRTQSGLVVFRAPAVDRSLLTLRTTEDVFLLAWGTDQLTYRAVDLQSIRRWTERGSDWKQLLQFHHAIRPKPKGKPTMRLVVQMEGKHGYRRIDARQALARGLAGKLPASWQHVEENAAIEIWLTIHGASAVCGVRLSDRTMRHRTYKEAHRAASLRPTVAAAMARLAQVQPGQTVLDPMCGAGTILAEVHALGLRCQLGGGDEDAAALRAANVNLPFERARLEQWDARRLPLEDGSVDRIISNLPFGKQLSRPELIGPLYRRLLPEFQRVLRRPGRAVLLAADAPAMQDAARLVGWKSERRVSVRILGQKATIFVYANFV